MESNGFPLPGPVRINCEFGTNLTTAPEAKFFFGWVEVPFHSHLMKGYIWIVLEDHKGNQVGGFNPSEK